MTRINKKLKAFANRAALEKATTKPSTDCCDDDVVFILKDQHHEFSLSLTTLLQCLRFAEQQGAVPALPAQWWWSAKG